LYAVASVAVFALLATTEARCQVPSWVNILDDAGQFETANHVEIDPGGDIIVGGLSYSSSRFGLRLAKLDPSGTVIWSNFFPTNSGIDAVAGMIGLAVDGAGNIAVVWRDGTGAFTMKVSGDGVELWRAVYDSPGRFEWPAGIVVDDEGRTSVGGYTSVRQPTGTLLTSAFIVSYDASGRLLWQDQDFGKQDRETVYDIVRDPASGAIYLAGELDKNFGGLGRQSPWLVRYDPDGRRVWEKHYRQPGAIAFAQKAVVGPDGNVVLAVDSPGYMGFQVLKVDAASGKELWTAEHGEPAYNIDSDVGVDGSGNVFFISSGVLLRYTPDGALSWSVVGNIGGRLAVDASGSAYILWGWRTFGYDATGREIWRTVYDAGPPLSTLNNALVITPAGDMILAGGEGDIHVLSYRLP